MTKLMIYCFLLGILAFGNTQAQNSNFKWISLNENTNFPTDEVYHIQQVEDGQIAMSTIGDGLVFLTDLEEITAYNQTFTRYG